MANAIYARKSTESEDRQVQSLDDQLKELHEIAGRSGIHIAETLLESKSAKEPYSRPEFRRLIELIESGKITGLITWHINRLARNMIDGGIIAHLLQIGKLEFILTPQRKYLPEDSALLLAIENGMATSYIQDLSRAVTRGMKGKAERGWYPGRAPLGYRNNRNSKQIDVDPERFALIKKGFELILHQSFTVAEARRALLELGLTVKSRIAKGKAPSISVFYRMFSNPFYAGRFFFHGDWVQGLHTPMISWEEFERVQALLGRGVRRKKRVHSHIYSGIFLCPVCGCRIVGDTRRKVYKRTNHEVDYTYYHCTGYKGCSKHGVIEETVVTTMASFMESVSVTPAFSAWMKEQVRKSAANEQATTNAAVDALTQEVSDTKRRIASLRELRIAGELPATEYLELRSEAETTLHTLAKRQKVIHQEGERIQAYVDEKLDAAERAGGFDELATGFTRGLIESLSETCFLTPENLQFKLDPVIAKIATFGPLRSGSQNSKTGDLQLDFSVWSSLAEDILTLARQKVRSQYDPKTEAPQPVEWTVPLGASHPRKATLEENACPVQLLKEKQNEQQPQEECNLNPLPPLTAKIPRVKSLGTSSTDDPWSVGVDDSLGRSRSVVPPDPLTNFDPASEPSPRFVERTTTEVAVGHEITLAIPEFPG